jgi:hypothetical protein
MFSPLPAHLDNFLFFLVVQLDSIMVLGDLPIFHPRHVCRLSWQDNVSDGGVAEVVLCFILWRESFVRAPSSWVHART